MNVEDISQEEKAYQSIIFNMSATINQKNELICSQQARIFQLMESEKKLRADLETSGFKVDYFRRETRHMSNRIQDLNKQLRKFVPKSIHVGGGVRRVYYKKLR